MANKKGEASLTIQKGNYTYHKNGANLSVIKIDGTHCFCCGVNMAGTTPDDMRTRHHAIPEELKPVRNIVIPVCRKCHTRLHTSASLGTGNEKLKKKVDALSKNFDALKKTLDNLKLEVK